MIIKSIEEEIIERLDLSLSFSEEEIMELIDRELVLESKRREMSLKDREKVRKKIYQSIRQYGILQDLLEDSEITEIMVNGTDGIFVEKMGKLSKIAERFESKDQLKKVIWQITAGCNRVVNELSPIVDARLPDGARVNVVLDPVALNGPILTIRRFPVKPITIDDLIRYETITKEAAAFLKEAVENGMNILVSGGTGSGKTTPDKSTQFSDGKSGY